MSLPSDVPPDLSQKSLIHLHKAAQTLLPVNQSLSSHLGSHLLSTAHEADINLPQSYIETRFCRRCGTPYVPGVTCLTRCSQSRRQKRKAKGFIWVVCECKVCNGQFRTEVENSTPTAVPIKRDSEIEAKSVTRKEEGTPGDNTRKRRKRETLKGLIGAIEKSKAEKIPELGLQDLMKFP